MNNNGKSKATFNGLGWSTLLDRNYQSYKKVVRNPVIITERISISDIDLKELDVKVPVYLGQYGRYYALISVSLRIRECVNVNCCSWRYSMANNEDERILSIKVKYQDAINGILEYQNKLQALKKEQEKWKNEVVDGTKNFNEYNAAMADIKIQMAEAKDGIRVLEKEARNNLKTQQENEGSLKSLRAELSNSTKAYDEMSRTEREGAKGKELQDHINAVTNELNEAEQKTQRFYRNVGRYEDSVKDALISLQKQIQEADKEYNKLVKTEGEHAKSTRRQKSIWMSYSFL